MSVNTVILQDYFVSDGENRMISIPSGVNWIEVVNFTQYGLSSGGGIRYYWQAGMPDGSGVREVKEGVTDNTLSQQMAAPEGFTILDQSEDPKGPQIAVTAGTNATQPVISTGDTTGLVDGSIVRLYADSGTTAPNLTGIDFEIDNVVANTSFRIANALANTPGAIFGTGNYRRIKWDPLFFPRSRFIVNITRATQGVVTTSVRHQYSVGQKVTFKIPAQFEMVELDGITATIVAVTDSTFTIDVDTTNFTTFLWPDAAGFTAVTWAKVNPASFDTAEALSQGVDTLSGAVENQGIRGVILAGGATSPGGANGDMIFWRAGRSELGPRSG